MDYSGHVHLQWEENLSIRISPSFPRGNLSNITDTLYTQVSGDLSYSFSNPQKIVTASKTLVDRSFSGVPGVSFSPRREKSFIRQGEGRDFVLLQPPRNKILKASSKYLDLEIREVDLEFKILNILVRKLKFQGKRGSEP